jgi:hypothetical protein
VLTKVRLEARAAEADAARLAREKQDLADRLESTKVGRVGVGEVAGTFTGAGC